MRRYLMPLIAAVLTSALVAAAAMGAGSAPRHRPPKPAHAANSMKRTSHSKAACPRPASPKAPRIALLRMGMPPAPAVPIRSSAPGTPCTQAPAPPVAVIPGA